MTDTNEPTTPDDPGYDPYVRALVLHAIEHSDLWATYDVGVLTNGECLHQLTTDIARHLEANHVVALPDLPTVESEHERLLHEAMPHRYPEGVARPLTEIDAGEAPYDRYTADTIAELLSHGIGWTNGPRAHREAAVRIAQAIYRPDDEITLRIPTPDIIEAILEILNDFEEAPSEAIADSIFRRLVELHAERRSGEPQWLGEPVEPQDLHPWSELSNTGLLWLINTSVFHPRGFGFGIDIENDGWRLFAAEPGQCFDYLPWTEDHPNGIPLDEMFRRAEAFMASVRLEQWGERIEPEPEQVSIADVIETINAPIEDDEDVEYQGDGWREIDGVDMDEPEGRDG